MKIQSKNFKFKFVVSKFKLYVLKATLCYNELKECTSLIYLLQWSIVMYIILLWLKDKKKKIINYTKTSLDICKRGSY